jgi:ribulose-5-phosphate 4-epimerase/fuculose-1-phosphate aldolase
MGKLETLQAAAATDQQARIDLALANHGVIVVGPTVAEAYGLLYYLDREEPAYAR